MAAGRNIVLVELVGGPADGQRFCVMAIVRELNFAVPPAAMVRVEGAVSHGHVPIKHGRYRARLDAEGELVKTTGGVCFAFDFGGVF